MAEILGEKYFNKPVTWEYLTRHFFFEPLNIQNELDLVGHDFHSFDRLANAYFTSNGKYRQVDNKALDLITPAGPAGSVCISTKGMAVWMEFLINRGVHKGRQLVSREVIEETWKPRIATGQGKETGMSNYALGWGVNEYRG